MGNTEYSNELKKAEEYFEFMSSEDDIIDLYEKSKEDFIKAIEQAQKDVIEYITTKKKKEAKENYRQALDFIEEKFLYHNELVTIADIKNTIEIATGLLSN